MDIRLNYVNGAESKIRLLDSKDGSYYIAHDDFCNVVTRGTFAEIENWCGWEGLKVPDLSSGYSI